MTDSTVKKVIKKWKSSARKPPVVNRQELIWASSFSESFKLKEFPYRVWTLYEDIDPQHKPSLPFKPKHNVNAFMEDYRDDWIYVNSTLRYYSRLPREASGCWLLIEYADNNPWFTAK